MRKEILTGRKFGRLTVKDEVIRTDVKKKATYWNCACNCGKKTVVVAYNLKSGHIQSCGCLQKERTSKARLDDITGKEFGRLKVLKRHSNMHPPKWECICKCGNKTIVQGMHLKSRHTKSCGCLSIEKSTERIAKFEHLKGENHPSYNPEITDEQRIKGRFLYADKLKAWRTKVFTRDDFTCCICNVRGNGTLHAHHLNGYHWFVDGRFDEGNGVTLCEVCHKDFHRTYGTRNNTKEQFDQYVKLLNTQLI